MPTLHAPALLAASTAALAVLTLTACTTPAPTPPPSPSASTPAKPAPPTSSVTTADSPLGRILVDESGRTLYAFTKDKPGDSTCDADCIAVWPALISTRPITAGPGARPALLTQAKLAAGAEQAVYGDWPLYYYVGDTTPGDINGQGLDSEWFVIAPNGRLIKRSL